MPVPKPKQHQYIRGIQSKNGLSNLPVKVLVKRKKKLDDLEYQRELKQIDKGHK